MLIIHLTFPGKKHVTDFSIRSSDAQIANVLYLLVGRIGAYMIPTQIIKSTTFERINVLLNSFQFGEFKSLDV